jgi:hypothetical protein
MPESKTEVEDSRAHEHPTPTPLPRINPYFGTAATTPTQPSTNSATTTPRRMYDRTSSLATTFANRNNKISLDAQIYLILERAIYSADSATFWIEWTIKQKNGFKPTQRITNYVLPECYKHTEEDLINNAAITGDLPKIIWEFMQVFACKKKTFFSPNQGIEKYSDARNTIEKICKIAKTSIAKNSSIFCCSARNDDNMNELEEFLDVIAKIPKKLNKDFVDKLHGQFKKIDSAFVANDEYYARGMGPKKT